MSKIKDIRKRLRHPDDYKFRGIKSERQGTDKLVLQERDIEIIREIYTYRLATARQMTGLLGGQESKVPIRRRMGMLADIGYLEDLPREHRQQELVFALGNKGADILAETDGIYRGKIDWRDKNKRVKRRHIEHTLGITEFFCRLIKSTAGHPDVSFVSAREILCNVSADQLARNRSQYGKSPLYMRVNCRHGGNVHEIGVAPDAMFALQYHNRENKRLFFFYEHDRGTEVVVPNSVREGRRIVLNKATIYKKMLGYLNIYKQGIHTEHFGVSNFVVLFGTHSADRINSFKEAEVIVYDSQSNPIVRRNIFMFAPYRALTSDDVLTYSWARSRGANKVNLLLEVEH